MKTCHLAMSDTEHGDYICNIHFIALLSCDCSTGSPCNTFEFIISPLFQSLGYASPRVTLDTSLALAISRIFLFISTMFYPWLDSKWIPQPLILPAEVYKVSLFVMFNLAKYGCNGKMQMQ
jgi:hypothetical protein